jgi:hypothetical protein
MKITEQIKTFGDACKALGLDPAQVDQFPNIQNDLLIGIRAFTKLLIIAEALNEGYQPDWNNPNEYKHQPWFDMRSKKVGSGLGLSFGGYDSDYSGSTVGSRLVFRSSELARYAWDQFPEIYADAFVKNRTQQ